MVTGRGTFLRDSDVIWNRASWVWWDGGRYFSHRALMDHAENLTISDIRVEDPLPSLNAFQLTADSGSLHNVVFRDIQIRARGSASNGATDTCPPWGCTPQNGVCCNCAIAAECSSDREIGSLMEHGLPNIISTCTDKCPTMEERLAHPHSIRNIRFEGVTVAGVPLADIVWSPFNKRSAERFSSNWLSSVF